MESDHGGEHHEWNNAYCQWSQRSDSPQRCSTLSTSPGGDVESAIAEVRARLAIMEAQMAAQMAEVRHLMVEMEQRRLQEAAATQQAYRAEREDLVGDISALYELTGNVRRSAQ
ncbi:hypothetical protein PT974_02818 [Cladobotryum mycophilum]|uniref:Uncharacterized protein n=1 Tax=Cladobotryum mycophilum TaxID=491253 RepID=A0ABR0T015_9HYPO